MEKSLSADQAYPVALILPSACSSEFLKHVLKIRFVFSLFVDIVLPKRRFLQNFLPGRWVFSTLRWQESIVLQECIELPGKFMALSDPENRQRVLLGQ